MMERSETEHDIIKIMENQQGTSEGLQNLFSLLSQQTSSEKLSQVFYTNYKWNGCHLESESRFDSIEFTAKWPILKGFQVAGNVRIGRKFCWLQRRGWEWEEVNLMVKPIIWKETYVAGRLRKHVSFALLGSISLHRFILALIYLASVFIWLTERTVRAVQSCISYRSTGKKKKLGWLGLDIEILKQYGIWNIGRGEPTTHFSFHQTKKRVEKEREGSWDKRVRISSARDVLHGKNFSRNKGSCSGNEEKIFCKKEGILQDDTF